LVVGFPFDFHRKRPAFSLLLASNRKACHVPQILFFRGGDHPELDDRFGSSQTRKTSFAEETKSLFHRDTTTKQTLTLAGMDIDTNHRRYRGNDFDRKRAADGTLKVEEKMTRCSPKLRSLVG